MPDINNAVALGVQAPPQQRPADIIAPISSLAQLSLLGANAERVKAETGQIGQTTEFARAKNLALQNFNTLRGQNVPVAEALDKSGLAGWDPAGANAILGNVKTGKELTAISNYKPGNPASLAAGGPELVGKELTNQSTAATTAETNTKVTQQHVQLYGQVGNIMTAPGGATPQGRQIAADLARKAGIPEAKIQQFMALPDAQYVTAGQHLQVASMTPEKYMDTSGQTKLNQGKAEAATKILDVEPGKQIFMGPAAREAFTGAAPSAGTVGAPSLGNFAPPAAQPQLGAPTLAGPGGAPVQPGLTPAAPAVGVVPAAPAATGAPPAPVRNVNAVAVPSVGVNIPPEIAEVAKKYEAQRPGLAAYLGRTSQMESGGNPNAYNAGSKAAGPFQFVPSTGAAYLNGKSPFDLAGSADAAARLAIDNDRSLTKSLGQSPTDAQLYLAHQQGAGGAAKLLLNPNVRAGDLVGNTAIASNGGNPNAPASAFTNLWATKFNGGVGRSIPGAALTPSVTPVSPAASAILAPGGIAPLPAALSPAPTPGLPAPAAPPAAAAPAAPIQNAPPLPAIPTAPIAQPVTPGGAPPPTGLAADNTRPLQPVISGQSPGILAEQKTQGEEYGKVGAALDTAATSAKATNTTLDNMATASDSWRMGKWADKEETAREGLQAVAKSLGVNTPGLDKPIADYQDFQKLSGNILRQASHETSSRVGVQEMQLIAKSLPNPEMSEGGFKQIATQLKGVNDFAVAKQQAAADWKAANGGSLGPNKSGKDFQASWNAQASPAAFVLQRMKEENPQGLQNLISTLSKTKEGRDALGKMQSQWNTANDNGWLRKNG